MRITWVRLQNYKSFRDSGKITLGAGFTTIIGQNNVGKTALIEALGGSWSNIPHRSIETVPTPTSRPLPSPMLEFGLDLSWVEVRRVLAESGSAFYISVEQPNANQHAIAGFALRALQDAPTCQLTCTVTPDANLTATWDALPAATKSSILINWNADGTPVRADESVHMTAPEIQFPTVAARAAHARIFSFRAGRFIAPTAAISHAPVLVSSAANLAACLHYLQASNPVRYDRLQCQVIALFPTITQVTTPITSTNHSSIAVWTVPPASERGDLAISLADSGTGIGQALAILYVIETAMVPQVIIIDEPQSFLHPSAIRKLLEIIASKPQHQYICATHSPLLVAATDASALLLVRLEAGESRIDELDPNDTADLRMLLLEVGARLSDVFGAEAILWVEGSTEEESFELIRRKLLPKRPIAMAILGVEHTSAFKRKTAEAVVQIYTRLSRGRSLLPPAVGFMLDRELRSPEERADLERIGITFLDRRMYENYLLHACAIHCVITAVKECKGISLGAIQEWSSAHWRDPSLYAADPSSMTDDQCGREIDAATFLERLFVEVTETRLEYDKVRHGAQLTGWLCDNAFDSLAEVAARIKAAMDHAGDLLPP